MRKALILGAGGTGAKVIKRINELTEWRNDKSLVDYPTIKFFEIDTATESISDGGINSFHLGVSVDQVNRFKGEMNKGHHTWADKNGIDSVTEGAGETRVKGKFAFLYHYDHIKSEVKNRIKELYSSNDGDNISQKKRIYIVANSVSGTGSGCFVDYGFLVREIIRENNNYRNDTLLNVTLILTLPTRYDKELFLRNSYHALEELNHYMSGNQYSIEHATRNEIIRGDTNFPFFDYVYLVGPKSSHMGNDRARVELEAQELEEVIGEYIYNDIFSPSANTRDSARDNMNKFENSKDRMGYCQKYMTFGFSTIEYPMVQISKASTFKYLLESLNEWRKNSDIRANPSLNAFYLKNGSFRTEGSIFYELLRETTIDVHGGIPQSINIESMIIELKNNAFRNFIESGYKSKYLTELLDLIDDGFKEGNVGNEYGKGIIRAVIQENERRLKSDNDGWSKIIKNKLLNIVFTEKDGLRIAQANLDSINKHLDAIVSQEITENPVDIRSDIVSICDDIESIQTDKLLRVGWLNTFPRNQRVEKCRRQIDQYINVRLNIITIETAKKLLAFGTDTAIAFGLRKSLDNFKDRLGKFENDIETWIANLSKEYYEAINFKKINGHIVWRDQLGVIASDLILNSGKKTPAFINGSLRRTFEDRLLNDSDILTSNVCIRDKDIKQIIDLERGHFISLLSDKKVIDEFLKEEQHRNDLNNSSKDVIVEARDKATPFIDKGKSDNFVGDKDALEKLWVFYPGGQIIGSTNDTTSNPFASQLQKRNIISKWSEQSQDSSDDRIILFLEEQAGFPLRLLNMINEATMKRSLENGKEMSGNNINTFISRIDIEFLPIEINDPEKLNAVKILFIESIAVGSLILRNECFAYGKDNSGNMFNNNLIDSLRLPNQLRTAIYKLYHDESSQNKLKKANDEFIKNNKTTFLENLCQVLKNARAHGLKLSEREEIDVRETIRKDYICGRNLRDEWNILFGDEHFISDDDLEVFMYIPKVEPTVAPEFPNVGWYCKKCGQFMGDETIAGGQPDLNAPVRFKKVHICNL